jgi:hypothetical protein
LSVPRVRPSEDWLLPLLMSCAPAALDPADMLAPGVLTEFVEPPPGDPVPEDASARAAPPAAMSAAYPLADGVTAELLPLEPLPVEPPAWSGATSCGPGAPPDELDADVGVSPNDGCEADGPVATGALSKLNASCRSWPPPEPLPPSPLAPSPLPP